MITVTMERADGFVGFRFVCPLCKLNQLVETAGTTSTTDTPPTYGYWGSRHSHKKTCSSNWIEHLHNTLEDMYSQSYGDTDTEDAIFTDEQLEEIRSGIEVAINKLYEDNKLEYLLDTF